MDLKKLKSQLLLQYKYKIELHAHTCPASDCSQIKPKEMVETYKNLGYDAVVITNHFIYKRIGMGKDEYIDAFMNDFNETEKYGCELGVKVYLGVEIRFTENNNDYLIFGINKEMLSDIYDLLPEGVENFRKNFSMPDSVFIQAHPFRDGMELVNPSILDGVEVFNMHPGHNSKIGIASVYANNNNIDIITAGSDFHHPNRNHEGLSALRCDYLPKDSFELAKLIRRGSYLLEIGKNTIVIP